MELSHIKSGKVEDLKRTRESENQHSQQQQQQQQHQQQNKKRNIRLGFVIPSNTTSTTKNIKGQKKSRTTPNVERVPPESSNTRDVEIDALFNRTATAKRRISKSSNHHNTIDVEELDFDFDSGHTNPPSSTQLLTTDENVKPVSSVTTPRIRSDRPTTKPLHLGLHLLTVFRHKFTTVDLSLNTTQTRHRGLPLLIAFWLKKPSFGV